MVLRIIYISVLLLCFKPCLAFNLHPFKGSNKSKYVYPEERHKDISIQKRPSPLAFKAQERSKLKKVYDKFSPDLDVEVPSRLLEFGMNKFSFGNGIVDVTFQVKNGVEYALKDTLGDYPEFQRRKLTEELLNANYRTHKKVSGFLLDSGALINGDVLTTAPNLLKTVKRISKRNLIERAHEFFKSIALYLMFMISAIIFFKRLGSEDLMHAITTPLFKLLGAWVLIGFIGPIMNLIVNLLIGLNRTLIISLPDLFYYNMLNHNNLKYSWQGLANDFGYMPVMVLSVIDTLAQFFVYFFVAGLILNIVIAKIIAPLWALGLVSDGLKSSSFNSFVEWCKTLLLISLIPLVYVVLNMIAREFRFLNLDFLEIAVSILSLVYLPLLSNMVFARSGAMFKPVLSGYQNLLNSINASYQELKSMIELNLVQNYRQEQDSLRRDDLLYRNINTLDIGLDKLK